MKCRLNSNCHRENLYALTDNLKRKAKIIFLNCRLYFGLYFASLSPPVFMCAFVTARLLIVMFGVGALERSLGLDEIMYIGKLVL